MSIEKYIEKAKEELNLLRQESCVGVYCEVCDERELPIIKILRTSLEEYGREVIDKCIKALPEENRLFALFGDCKRGAITIDLAVYNIKDSIENLNNLK